jgi:Na+/proline symporter
MHTTDIIIFVIFFIINVVIGLIARGKKQTFKEYAIGNKDFSTATIVATIVATWASGSMFFNGIEQTYSNGLYYLLPALVGSTFSWLVTGYVIGPRMGALLEHVSMADALSDIYGKRIQFIVGLSTLLGNIGIIAIQFKVISRVLAVLFDYQGPGVTIIAAGIIIVYSAFGGIKAVTFTDVIQFITFGTLIPVLALVIWYHLQNPSQAVAHTLTTNPHFNLGQTVQAGPRFMDMVALIFYYSIPSLAPQLFQRMAMASHVGQIKRSIIYSTGILILIRLFIAWIAILLLSENADLKTSEVIGYMIEKHTYVGLKGFLAVGIIALAMSTADSALNSCAVLITNDILPPLRITNQASVHMATIVTFVIGAFSILLALSVQNILQILLLSANFDLPVITIPILLTIFGFRTSKRVIYRGMGVGFAMTVFMMAYSRGFNGFVPGMFINLIFLLGSHYLLKEQGGWTRRSMDPNRIIRVENFFPITWQERWKSIKNFKLLSYLEKRLPTKESYYPLLGFYLLTASYFALYSLSREVQQHYIATYRMIQVTILLAATSLLSFSIWPQKLKQPRILKWLWPSILLYVLFFIGAIVVIMSGFEVHQVFIFLFSLVMTVLISSWQLGITLALLGIILASFIFQYFMGGMPTIQNAIPISFQIGYGLILFSSLLIAVRTFKQANQDLTSEHEYLSISHRETSQELVRSLNAEERFIQALDVEGIKEIERTALSNNALGILLNKLKTSPMPAYLLEEIDHVKQRLDTTAKYLSAMVHRATAYLQLQVQKQSVRQLIDELLARLKSNERTQAQRLFVEMKVALEIKTIEADIVKLKQLLEHAIAYAQSKLTTSQQAILLGIEETKLGYPTNSIKEHVKQVPAICFTVTTASEVPAGKGLYLNNMEKSVFTAPIDSYNVNLLLNQRILHAHYGFMAVEKDGNNLTQVYVIPQAIREIRPKEMDIPEIDPDTKLQPSDENYPGAKEQEQAFLDILQLDNQDQLALIYKALRFIKKYHGPVKRKSGEPFYLHPVMVAKIVASFTQDLDTVLGALLHDVVEDTAVTLSQVELMFNKDVKRIVDGVTHLDSLSKVVYRLQLGDHENINQLLDTEDKRVLYVKLADRTHNMRTIQFHKLEKQKQIASETLAFFVPVARYLGLMEIADELQQKSNEVINQKG